MITRQRPPENFDRGLQHERTAMGWERTAISMVVAGLVLARYAAVEAVWWLAAVGLAQTLGGAVLVVWAGAHYEDLHEPLRAGDDVVHPSAARMVGIATVICTGAALVLGVTVAVRT